MLQLAEVENPFAAEHPSDDEIAYDEVNRENGVAHFVAREAAHGLDKLDFSKVAQKDLDAAEARGMLQRKFGLDFAGGCGSAYLCHCQAGI